MCDTGPAEELMLFQQVHRAHRNATTAALAKAGLQDIGQPGVLFYLNRAPEEGVTQNKLAEAVRVSPSTMAASLKSLESNGYVTKHSDSSDGRCKRVCITQKGRDVIQRCFEAFRSVDRQLYAGFAPEEVELLKGAYRHMLDNLFVIGGAQDPEDAPLLPPLRKEDKT